MNQLPNGTGRLVYPAYFGFFWLLFRSTPGQVNTGRLLDVQPGYKLGSPTRGVDTNSYPITFRDSRGWPCWGRVDLQWNGFVGGWPGAGADAACHAG